MTTLREDFKQGTVNDSPLGAAATTINSAEFADLQAVTGGSGDIVKLILDPAGANGDPEIVYVTAHTASASAVTVTRAQEGTTAREHPATTVWKHGPTAADYGAHIGVMEMYLGLTAPDLWVFARGQELSRTTYAILFAVIGEDYGVGDGSTTFNVPDLRGVFPVGASDIAGDYDLADTGGKAQHTLTTAEMPSHTHTGPSHSHGDGSLSAASNGSHSHDMDRHFANDTTHHHGAGATGAPFSSRSSASGSTVNESSAVDSGGTHTHDVTGSTAASGTGNTGSAGSGNAHENRPPFLAVNFIIFAGV